MNFVIPRSLVIMGIVVLCTNNLSCLAQQAPSCPFIAATLDCGPGRDCDETSCEYGDINSYTCDDIDSNGNLDADYDCPAETFAKILTTQRKPLEGADAEAGSDGDYSDTLVADFQCFKQRFCSGSSCAVSTHVVKTGMIGDCSYRLRAAYCGAPVGPTTDYEGGLVTYNQVSIACADDEELPDPPPGPGGR